MREEEEAERYCDLTLVRLVKSSSNDERYLYRLCNRGSKNCSLARVAWLDLTGLERSG